MSPARVFGISNCDTVKRARQWLDGAGQPHEFHDFKKAGVPVQRLDLWLAACGWEPLLNRRGTTWRGLDEDTQRSVVDAASARGLMLAQPSVIKRPVVEWPDGSVTVGFDASAWAHRVDPASATSRR
jgi:Spx/MgsR family transcriptional regulator